MKKQKKDRIKSIKPKKIWDGIALLREQSCECSRGEVSSFDCLTHKSWHAESKKKRKNV